MSTIAGGPVRPAPAAGGPRYFRFMLPLVLGTVLNPLNSSMLATALPSLCHSFGRSLSDGALLITPLYVTSAIGQPLMGRLADVFSPKKVNLLGFGLVLLGALGPSFGWLVAARIVLGLGTSAAYPSAIALVQQYYDARQRPVLASTLGLIAVAGQVCTVLGPTLGGFLTQWFGWVSIFWVNVPWVLLAVALTRYIPAFPARPVRPAGLLATLDAGGILLFSLLLVSLFLGLTHHAWLPALALGALIWWERRQARPFIDVRLLGHNLYLALVYLSTLASNYLLYLLFFALPLWLQAVRHAAPGPAGLLLLPMSAASVGAALVVSRGHFNNYRLGIISLAAACAGLFGLHAGISTVRFVGLTLLVGLTLGINTITTQTALNEEAPASQKGTSFGLYRTFGYLGAIVAGSQLKALFPHGVTEASFGAIRWYALACAGALTLLYLPLLRRRNVLARALHP